MPMSARLAPTSLRSNTETDTIMTYPAIVYAHTSVNVATTTTQAIAVNVDRKFLLLQNISDTAIDIKVGAVAVAGEGIRVYANGNFEMKPGNGNLNTGAVNAIHAGAGNKTLLVTEG